MRLVENAHFKCGHFDGLVGGEARLPFEVGVRRDPWSPPCDLAIPQFGLLVVDYEVKDFRGREVDLDVPAMQNRDAPGEICKSTPASASACTISSNFSDPTGVFFSSRPTTFWMVYFRETSSLKPWISRTMAGASSARIGEKERSGENHARDYSGRDPFCTHDPF